MLKTPASFTPLIAPVTHPDPLTLVFCEGRVLVREAGLEFAAEQVVEQLALPAGRMHAVGMLDGRYVRTAWADSGTEAPAGHEFRSLRSMFGSVDDELLGLAGRAAQVSEWARTHRFCGACGKPTTLSADERCAKCACGHLAYPRISPAMMVLIRKGDSVLLAMHVQSPSKRYTPLAGFLEAGESIEEAVHREVYEEVGLRVHNLQYFGSQSWPFPHSLMIAFTADYLDGEIRVDPSEISDARWFGPGDEWPEPISHFSISAMLVDAYRPR
ncbi:MAG TPA: NAD(+) diphosphatase [Telluria sp.]|nr:NAD(+) diphosphatase [Telluria sp.]